jgi:hypothetical protein
MGNFGIGGLVKPTTWIPPVATFAALPAAALPGSVSVALDTGIAYEFIGGIWTPLATGGSGGNAGTIIRPYAAGVIVNDAVFQKADGTAAPTSAVDQAHMPCIGFVSALDTPAVGMCKIQQNGDLGGFSGLTPGNVYICSKNLGQILWEGDTGNVDYPGTNELGTVVQSVGIAATATTLNIQLGIQEVN